MPFLKGNIVKIAKKVMEVLGNRKKNIITGDNVTINFLWFTI